MIIRQSISFAARLLGSIFLVALMLGSIKARRAADRSEPLKPRYSPTPARSPAPDASQ